jgi:hypothetical protein
MMWMMPSRRPLALASSGSPAKTKKKEKECIWTAMRRGDRLRKNPE